MFRLQEAIIRGSQWMCTTCKLGAPWWWLLEAETYVGAIDSVYENTVHMLVSILWPPTCSGHSCGTSLRMATCVVETSRQNYYVYNIFSKTCVHLAILVATSNCSMHGYGPFKVPQSVFSYRLYGGSLKTTFQVLRLLSSYSRMWRRVVSLKKAKLW
jgi:hypothetical protein